MEELGVHLIVPFIEVSESRADPIIIGETNAQYKQQAAQAAAV